MILSRIKTTIRCISLWGDGMGLNIGTAGLDNLMLGSQEVDKVMLGTTEVWTNNRWKELLFIVKRDKSAILTMDAATLTQVRQYANNAKNPSSSYEYEDIAGTVKKLICGLFSRTSGDNGLCVLDPDTGAVLSFDEDVIRTYSSIYSVGGTSQYFWSGYDGTTAKETAYDVNTYASVKSTSSRTAVKGGDGCGNFGYASIDGSGDYPLLLKYDMSQSTMVIALRGQSPDKSFTLGCMGGTATRLFLVLNSSIYTIDPETLAYAYKASTPSDFYGSSDGNVTGMK